MSTTDSPRPRRRIQRRSIPAARFSNNLSPLLQRIYAARQVLDDEALRLDLDRLLAPQLFKGMSAAVELLLTQLEAQGRVLVVGDFDADGATSCALMLRGLRYFGFLHVDYLVPNRFEFGYGLTPEIVDLAAARKPDLIITVDNGISSIEGVTAARAHGIRVLITDHHLPGETLPAADAIINPNQPGCDFPEKSMAGVGVAFYLLLGLRAALRESGHFAARPAPRLVELLDLVALGTVADVVPLERNNRILVQHGIRRIRQGRSCAGILALLAVAGRDPARLVASDLGFAVAPRLNAAGRLEDMSQGIECLLSDDADQALTLATALDAINRQRRQIEADMREQAEVALLQMQLPGSGVLPAGLCMYDSQWHQGVIGILAARLKEKLQRPVIVFADAGEEHGVAIIKGSARSMPALHVRDALALVDARNPGLILRFGGHAMAAGLSIQATDRERFSTAFAEVVQEGLGARVGQGEIMTDGELSAPERQLAIAEMLREAGPWGQGFPEPLFDGTFALGSQRLVGGSHLKLVLHDVAEDQWLDAIAFNIDTQHWPAPEAQWVRVVYRMDVNEFRGERNLQLIIDHLEVIDRKT